MADPYVPLETSFGAGLNLADSPEEIGATEARVFLNMRIAGGGRVRPRMAAIALETIADVIGIFEFNDPTDANVAGIALAYNSDTSVVDLYSLDGSGAATSVGPLAGWTSVSTQPRVSCASIAGVAFICDEGKNLGLTCYDPADFFGSGSVLFQPTFDFDEDSSFGPMKPRFVIENNNHLWAFGYGEEGDADRGEIARFSYPGFDRGLADINVDAGDAGIGGATGSETMFDLSDAVPIGTRGIPIIGAAYGNGNMVIANAQRMGVLLGVDRDSWRFRWFEAVRGAPCTRSLVAADGIVYGLTTTGEIIRYTGGGEPEIISRRVKSRLTEINTETMFAAVQLDEGQVRWYHALLTDSNSTPDRWIGWDYINNAFIEDTLGYRCNCAGYIRPNGSEAPTSAPSAIGHDAITETTAHAHWTNGDTSPGVTTNVYLAPDVAGSPGTFVPVAALGPGVAGRTHTGLTAATSYWTKVEHVRNGQTSSSVQAMFTTLSAGSIPTPTSLAAEDDAVFDPPKAIQPSVLLSWTQLQSALYAEIHRSTTSGFTPSTGTRITTPTTGIDATSYRDNTVTALTTYYYKIRATDGAGNYSNYTADVTVTPTLGT